MKVKINPKIENAALARAARHAIVKSHLDISELNISSTGGTVELNGKIKSPRDYPGNMDVRKEFENLKNMIRNVRGVRDVNGERVKLFD